MARKRYDSSQISKSLKRIKAGETLEAVSKETGIPVATLYNWKERDAANGKNGQADLLIKQLNSKIEDYESIIADQALTIHKLQGRRYK